MWWALAAAWAQEPDVSVLEDKRTVRGVVEVAADADEVREIVQDAWRTHEAAGGDLTLERKGTDGDCALLIPLFVDAGVNYLEPFEVQAGMDVRKVREDFPELVIHGGLDKRALAISKEAVDEELEAKLTFMLERGGYIPAIDHVVPPDVPLENWRYFLERVRGW